VINSEKEIKKIVLKILKKKFLSNNTMFMNSNNIDSLKVIELVSALEAKFKIVFKNADFQIKNFNSLKSINKIVKSKLK
tara:strand:+ start:29718 stop:29954 length:237 start_codon:yes stop_codon:yes gene_type:complete